MRQVALVTRLRPVRVADWSGSNAPEAHVAEHTDLGVLVLALERDTDTAPTSPIMMLRELRCAP
jgi:hypothetical protein